MKALILGISKTFRQILQQALTEMDVKTVEATSEQEAWQKLSTGWFDFLILESQLQDTSALEFCRRFRAKSSYRLTPVLLMLGENSKILMHQALNAGITEVFQKSKMERIQDTLGRFVRRLHKKGKGRVLLVEDSATTAAVLTELLTRLHLRVDTFDNAEAALLAIAEQPYDLIVCDIVLAGKVTGLGLVEAVRTMEGEQCRTPILGLSSLNDTSSKIEMLKLGANDYVPKPIIEEEFQIRVSNLISNKQLLEQLQQQRQEIWEFSVRDPLTGLYNRHYLSEVAEQLISNMHRRHEPLSLLVVDVDHFKSINDTLGHDTGDLVLVAVGGMLSGAIRQEDVAARFGGEEFVIILANCAGQYAKIRANAILDELRSLNPQGVKVTASIGIATAIPPKRFSFTELFKAADQALYQAKHGGRDQVVLSHHV
ncbi:diguanylate cyclase [Aliiglaciecola sp. CAU 1673]|uniref:diguanylate cyclase n=1 Tax=Aliiglaciecola sp. CAU 1673 TaxID=3032595 RepID=UPI0023D9AF6A|nr:diguanylate cyclase [Aliiglaciecola sp. CAU 1673]MDF2180211.1 diguanylate cyclase [Aliiglaciecola sp. CAU 1673]